MEKFYIGSDDENPVWLKEGSIISMNPYKVKESGFLYIHVYDEIGRCLKTLKCMNPDDINYEGSELIYQRIENKIV